MLVVLDTTVLLADPTGRGTAWSVLAHAVSAWDVRLVVPEVVYVEAVAGFRRRTADAAAELNRFARKYGGPLGLRPAIERSSAEVAQAAEQYSETLRSMLNDLNAQIAGPPQVDHMVLVERAASRQRPCDRNGNGYRDTLNWLTVIALAEQHSDEPVVWVSNNSEDFGNDDKSGLHQDLIADLDDAKARNRVVWFSTLQDFVLDLAARKSPGMPTDLHAVQQQLSEQVLSDFITQEMLGGAAGRAVAPSACGLPLLTGSAQLAGFGEIRNVVVKIRGGVGDTDSVAEFTLETDATVQLEFAPGAATDDPILTPVSTEPGPASIHVIKPLVMGGLLKLDGYGRPTSGEISHIHARDDDPGLQIWKHRKTALDSFSALSPDQVIKFVTPGLQDAFKRLIQPMVAITTTQWSVVAPDVYAALARQAMPPNLAEAIQAHLPNVNALFSNLGTVGLYRKSETESNSSDADLSDDGHPEDGEENE